MNNVELSDICKNCRCATVVRIRDNGQFISNECEGLQPIGCKHVLDWCKSRYTFPPVQVQTNYVTSQVEVSVEVPVVHTVCSVLTAYRNADKAKLSLLSNIYNELSTANSLQQQQQQTGHNIDIDAYLSSIPQIKFNDDNGHILSILVKAILESKYF